MTERVMTCEEAAPLLDAFVDAELEGPALIDVARHAASCKACDDALQELIALHETLGRHGLADAGSVDLSGLWQSLEPELKKVDARRAWRRRLRSSSPLWGGLAIAASALLFLSGPQKETVVASKPPVYRPNQAVIERIDSEGGRFELRRERKNGTTLIMVSATGDDVP
jgi:anti-sigma factor RsiW